MKTIDDLLTRGRKVTEAHLKAGNIERWGVAEQILKIYEEAGEVQRAKSPLETLEEGSDVIYAVITLFHICGYDDYAIKESLESTMKKIEKRVGILWDKICPECGTKLEVVDYNLKTDNTHFYCPKCKAGSS